LTHGDATPWVTTDIKTSAAQHGVSMPVINLSLSPFPNPRRRLATFHKDTKRSSRYGRRYVAVRLTPAISKFFGDT
jgi:hypothetical protein